MSKQTKMDFQPIHINRPPTTKLKKEFVEVEGSGLVVKKIFSDVNGNFYSYRVKREKGKIVESSWLHINPIPRRKEESEEAEA